MLPAIRRAALQRLPLTRPTIPVHLALAQRQSQQIANTRWASLRKMTKSYNQPWGVRKREQDRQRQIAEAEAAAAAEAEAAAAAEAQGVTGQTQTPGVSEAERAENIAESSQTQSIHQASQPLPDLRYGIPSTFAEEYTKSSAQHGGSTQYKNLDITESEIETDSSRTIGGRGGDGPLPKSAYESSIDKRRNKMAQIFFILAGVAGVGGIVWAGREWEMEELAQKFSDAPNGWSPAAFSKRVQTRFGDSMGYYTEPTFPKLLPIIEGQPVPPYTLVLSFEDFLVHSEWTRENGWRTAKRPGCDFFLLYLSQYFELCLFTSISSGIADPIVRKLDPYRILSWALFREATRYDNGDYVKDLSYLNRPIPKTILLDTDPGHAKAQPENAIIIPPWKGDPSDRGLFDLIPLLEYIAIVGVEDVRTVLKSFQGKDIGAEFAIREAQIRQKFAPEIEAAQKNKRNRGSWSLANMVRSVVKAPGGRQPGQLPSLVEALADGKTLLDVMREEGMVRYRAAQEDIRKNGARWIAEEEELMKKLEEMQMKQVTKNPLMLLGIGPQGAPVDPQKMMAEAARELAAEKQRNQELQAQQALSK